MLNRLSHPQQNCRKINFGSSLSEPPKQFTFTFKLLKDHLCSDPDGCDEFVRFQVEILQKAIDSPIPDEPNLNKPNPDALTAITKRCNRLKSVGDFFQKTTDPTKPPTDKILAVVAKFLVDRHIEARSCGFVRPEGECEWARDKTVTDVYILTDDAKRNAGKYGDYPSLVLGRMVKALGDVSEHLLTTLVDHLRK